VAVIIFFILWILQNTHMENNIFNTRIETSRLLLRELTLADVDDMFEYTSNPIVTTHLSWNPHTNISQVKDFIKNVMRKTGKINTEFTYGIELKAENKLIGVLKVSNVCFHNQRGEFTSILNPKYQGKGYMGEARQGLLKYCFTKVGLKRIQSLVTEDNIPSQKMNDKSGLTYEGMLKNYWIMKGISKDALVYGITDEMYFNNQK